MFPGLVALLAICCYWILLTYMLITIFGGCALLGGNSRLDLVRCSLGSRVQFELFDEADVTFSKTLVVGQLVL